MKIGFDAKRAFYNFRGLGYFSRTLISNLAKYYPDNEYMLFSPGSGKREMQEWFSHLHNSTLVTPTSIAARMCSTSWRSLFLSKVLQRDPPDIYHGLSHELPPGIKKTGISSVVTIHDLLYLRYPQFYPWIDRKIYHKKFKYSVDVANKVIAICEQTKRDIIEFLDCPEEKIEVVYQSCNPIFKNQLFYDQKGEIQEKYNLPQEYLLSVGALVENKNTLSVIKALGIIKKRLSIPYVIVGKGEKYKKELLAQIEREKLTAKVIFIENIPADDLVGIYQNATAFIFPSFFEGFGIPIIEALQSGVPVITSKGFCFTESGGPESQYVDPNSIEEIGSAIERVLGDEGLRQKMINSGQQYVERFSQQKTSASLMDVYKSVL